MDLQLTEIASSLKELKKEECYQHFHDLQLKALGAQIKYKYDSLVEDLRFSNMAEISAPRIPILPDRFDKIVIQKIGESNSDLVFFNRSLFFTGQTGEVLSHAKSCGAQYIVIHDLPCEEAIFYETIPESQFFQNRNRMFKNTKLDSIENFQNAKNWAVANSWRILNNESLDFIYRNETEIKLLCQMELSLDLIESHYTGKASQFDHMLEEFIAWSAPSEVFARVKGCSHWLVLGKEE